MSLTIDGHKFPITKEHLAIMHGYLGTWDRCETPEKRIMPTGTPYLYRWYLTPKGHGPQVMFHLQVASDPERPLHDHPGDCTSLILVGGYNEWLQDPRSGFEPSYLPRRVGDMIYRPAYYGHRIVLPEGVLYTMTLFMMGPDKSYGRSGRWGFFMKDGWVNSDEITEGR